MQHDGFRLPWQVRYVRAWYLREARWHVDLAREAKYGPSDAERHLREAAKCRQDARGARDRFLADGKIPLVYPRGEWEAFPMNPWVHVGPIPCPPTCHACRWDGTREWELSG